MDLFLATFRGMPTANAEGWIESEGMVRNVSVRRVFRHLQTETGPRRSPSASSKIPRKKNRARPPFSDHQVPDLLMWEFLKPFAIVIGSATDDRGRLNDGIVNTASENGPKLNSTDRITVHNPRGLALNRLSPGEWNYMGCRSGIDHVEMVGIGVQEVKSFYLELARMLDSLPRRQSTRFKQ